MKQESHETFVRQLALALLPFMQRSVNIRKDMMDSETISIQHRSIDNLNIHEGLKDWYKSRQKELNSLERKYSWNELHPYDLDKLLTLCLSFEIKKTYGIDAHNLPDIHWLSIEEATEHDINNWDQNIKAKIKSWDFIWDIIEVIALQESIESVKTKIQTLRALVTEAESAISETSYTENNILDDSSIKDDNRIRIDKGRREDLIKDFLKLCGSEHILTKEEVLYWICADFQGFKQVKENRILTPNTTEIGLIIYFVRQIYEKYHPKNKVIVPEYRKMLKRRISLCTTASDSNLRGHFSRKIPAKFPKELYIEVAPNVVK